MIPSVDVTPRLEVKNYTEDSINEKIFPTISVLLERFEILKTVPNVKPEPLRLTKKIFV